MAIVWLDSGIIGLIANPHKQGEAEACERWLLGLAAKGVYIVSSSLCDYEVRRNLILPDRLSELRKVRVIFPLVFICSY